MSANPHTASAVCETFRRAAEANRAGPACVGNVVELTPDLGDEILIGADLHGNRLNFARLCQRADLAQHPRRHLLMQEVCHGGPRYPDDGGCMSHLLLEDVAALKVQFPDRFHFLLSNHELAELTDFPISKHGCMLNLAFRHGLTEMYGAEAERVREATSAFLASCPLAVRLPHGVFISHSLPDGVDTRGFDASVFTRPAQPRDWRPGGAVFRLVWGRDYRPANAQAFAALVQARLLIHGHEPCPNGCSTPNDLQVILDCCSERACFLRLPIGPRLSRDEVLARIERLHSSDRPQPQLART